ncbi:hypothetical protein BDR07DRAFT_1405196 [Suillus spraguei]|nr:hypothetical protein BDR07DRAFT_1405196 [Suillus spraguei]
MIAGLISLSLDQGFALAVKASTGGSLTAIWTLNACPRFWREKLLVWECKECLQASPLAFIYPLSCRLQTT